MFPNWALLLPLFGLVAFCRAQNSNNQCNPFICGNDWQNRTEPNDGKVYGYKVFLKSALNFFEAQRICRDQCAEVASVLNDDEYDFVLQVAGDLLEQCQTNASVCPIRDPNPEFNRILNGFWLGMHRVQQYTPYFANGPVDSEIVCMNSDRTNCSFGAYNGTIGEHEDIGLPWVTATPNGGNTADRAVVEDCVQMLDYNAGLWNDIPCHYQQGGVVCKRDCASYCQAQVGSTVPGESTTTTTTEATTTQPNGGNVPGGPGVETTTTTTEATTTQPNGGNVPGGPGEETTTTTTEATTTPSNGGNGPGEETTTTTEPTIIEGPGELTTTPIPTTRSVPLSPPPAPRRRRRTTTVEASTVNTEITT